MSVKELTIPNSTNILCNTVNTPITTLNITIDTNPQVPITLSFWSMNGMCVCYVPQFEFVGNNSTTLNSVEYFADDFKYIPIDTIREQNYCATSGSTLTVYFAFDSDNGVPIINMVSPSTLSSSNTYRVYAKYFFWNI